MEATMKKSEKPQLVQREPATKEQLLSYANRAIEKPKGIDIVKIIQITDHFFRVNYFIKKKNSPDSLMHNYDIMMSKMIEVVETADGFDLIDHTVLPDTDA